MGTGKKYILYKPFHTLLIAIIPVITLFTNNLGNVGTLAIVRTLVISLLLAGLFFLISMVVSKTSGKACILTSFFLTFFYSAIPLKNFIVQILHNSQFSVWIVALLGLSIGLVLQFRVLSRSSDLLQINQILNIAFMAMLILPLFNLTNYTIHKLENSSTMHQTLIEAGSQTGDSKPDIYYIVLDSYGRSDRLLSSFHYDNTEFLETLQEKGFYIASCSTANYSDTDLSMAATLNLDYIDTLPGAHEVKDLSTSSHAWIKDSLVIGQLKLLGYQLVAFETAYPFLNFYDADRYYHSRTTDFFALSEFERIFLNNTPLRWISTVEHDLHYLFSLPILKNKLVRVFGYEYDLDQQILNLLEHVPELPSPKFVYAQIMAPHPPFVFDPTGRYTDNDYVLGQDIGGEFYVQGYLDEMRYLDWKIPEILQHIIDESSSMPIIILQADHGFNNTPLDEHSILDDRQSILNAYLFPGMDRDILYPSISPVNTFRLLFKTYFDLPIELLPDRSFFVKKPELDQLFPYAPSALCPVE